MVLRDHSYWSLVLFCCSILLSNAARYLLESRLDLNVWICNFWLLCQILIDKIEENFKHIDTVKKYLLAMISWFRTLFDSSLEAAFHFRFKLLSPLFEVICQILLHSIWISYIFWPSWPQLTSNFKLFLLKSQTKYMLMWHDPC